MKSNKETLHFCSSLLMLALLLWVGLTPVTANANVKGPVTINHRGRIYHLFEKKSRTGNPLRQIVLSQGRQDILLDTDNDGRIDTWEISTNEGSVHAWDPVGGKFTQVLVQLRDKHSLAKLRYEFDHSSRRLILISAQRERYKILASESTREPAGQRCEADPEGLDRLVLDTKAINQFLQDADNQAFTEGVRRNLIAGTCSSHPFTSSNADSIVSSLRTIAESDREWEMAPPKSKGTYLQCLRYLGLERESARVAAALASFHSSVGVPERLNWKIDCQDEGPSATWSGTYRTRSRTLTLNRSAFRTSAVSSSASLPKLIFHELLHHAGLNEPGHEQVDRLVECCESADNSESSACKEAKDLASKIESSSASDRKTRRDRLRDEGVGTPSSLDSSSEQGTSLAEQARSLIEQSQATYVTARNRAIQDTRETLPSGSAAASWNITVSSGGSTPASNGNGESSTVDNVDESGASRGARDRYRGDSITSPSAYTSKSRGALPSLRPEPREAIAQTGDQASAPISVAMNDPSENEPRDYSVGEAAQMPEPYIPRERDLNRKPRPSGARSENGPQQAPRASALGGSSSGGGPSAKSNSSPPSAIDPRTKIDPEEIKDRRTKLFIRTLTGPYEQIKRSLTHPKTVANLKEYRVWVVDDEGRNHGPSNPLHKMVYDVSESPPRLVHIKFKPTPEQP